MDALPADAPYAAAATDERPRSAHEAELCDKASTSDYLYMGASLAAFGAAQWADASYFKFVGYDPSSSLGPAARLPGPALVGLTWGFFVGGAYLSLPKCSHDWVVSAAPEGDYHVSWPLALGLAMLAGASAPVIDSYFIGGLPQQWPIYERSLRVITAGVGAFGGALLPYLLPPKTWRAAKELRELRANVQATAGGGGLVGVTLRF